MESQGMFRGFFECEIGLNLYPWMGTSEAVDGSIVLRLGLNGLGELPISDSIAALQNYVLCPTLLIGPANITTK